MIHQLISNNFLAQKYGKRLDNRTQSGEKLWYSQLIYTWMNIVHKVLKLKSSKWVLAITQILWETYTIKCDHHKTPTPISGPHPHQRSRSHILALGLLMICQSTPLVITFELITWDLKEHLKFLTTFFSNTLCLWCGHQGKG